MSANGLIPVCRGVYIHYFKINPPNFCCPLFPENYLNPQVRINKMVNKHTVNYHPSPSQLISRIHPHIFLWTPKASISPESFLNFILDLYIPLWLRKSFKFIVLRLLQDYWNFYSCFLLKQNSPPSLSLRQTGIAHSSRTAFSEDNFFSAERGGGRRIMELKKLPKLTRVLVTSFDKFHHLCNTYIFAKFQS